MQTPRTSVLLPMCSCDFVLLRRSTSCSSWSEQSEDKSLCGAEIHKPDPRSCPSLYGAGLYKCPSVLSVDSVASTFLPSPSPDSTRSSSTTRIGIGPVRCTLTALVPLHPPDILPDVFNGIVNWILFKTIKYIKVDIVPIMYWYSCLGRCFGQFVEVCIRINAALVEVVYKALSTTALLNW